MSSTQPAPVGPFSPQIAHKSRISARELVPLLTDWDAASGPGYRSLADRLRLLILEGRLPVGTVLPSERLLAEALDTSRTTTTSALRLLREAGFAVSSQGAGTWTALPNDQPAASAAASISLDGEPGPGSGRGDFSAAAVEAPPQLYGAYQSALHELPRYLSGNGYVISGLPALRARIAERYTLRGVATTPDQILVTAGALQALHLVLRVVADRGDRVMVEHPTYPAAAEAIRERGARPVPLPIEDGWDVERARTLIRQTGSQLAYLMIDFQNPTGAILGTEGRRRLGRAIAETGCTVIVDETMAELDLRAVLPRPAGDHRPIETPRPFAAFAPAENVISLGSASKVLWGGLRIGWVRASPPLIRRLAAVRANQDLGGSLLEQLATAQLLADLDPILEQRRQILADRCLTLRAALAEHLPDWVAPLPEGGLSLWCRLPQPRSSQVTSAARTLGITLTAGPRFGLDGAFETRLRIPYARPAEDLVAMAELLGRAWRSSDYQYFAESNLLPV